MVNPSVATWARHHKDFGGKVGPYRPASSLKLGARAPSKAKDGYNRLPFRATRLAPLLRHSPFLLCCYSFLAFSKMWETIELDRELHPPCFALRPTVRRSELQGHRFALDGNERGPHELACG